MEQSIANYEIGSAESLDSNGPIKYKVHFHEDYLSTMVNDLARAIIVIWCGHVIACLYQPETRFHGTEFVYSLLTLLAGTGLYYLFFYRSQFSDELMFKRFKKKKLMFKRFKKKDTKNK
jgi:hypothetical protein